MAESAAPAAEEAPTKPQRSWLKMSVLAINILLFVGGAGFFAWGKFGPKPPATAAAPAQKQRSESMDTGEHGVSSHESAKQQASKTPEGHAGTAPGGGHGATAKGGHGSAALKDDDGEVTLVPLAPFIVNLSGDNGQRYLRLVAQVEARGDVAKTELEARLHVVRNRLIFLLTSKTFNDIGSAQGKYDLQADITKNINETLDGPFIKRTYFTEFIVQ